MKANPPVWTPPASSRDEGAFATVRIVCSGVSGLVVALVMRPGHRECPRAGSQSIGGLLKEQASYRHCPAPVEPKLS